MSDADYCEKILYSVVCPSVGL